LLHIATELLDLGARHLSFVHRMYDSETMEEVARAEFLGVCFDSIAGVSIEMPELTRAHAMGLLIGTDHAALPLRRPAAA
jgi:acyl-CoA thioesterase FadM